MATFAQEWLFVLAALLGLSAIGGFVIMPFRRQLPYGFLAAPFCGILLLGLGGSFAYNDLGISLLPGLFGTAVLCTLVTALTVCRARLRPCWQSVCFAVLVTAAVAVPVVWTNAWVSITLGGPGLQFSQGTDHSNYAQMADWIAAHPPSDHPRRDPRVVYELVPYHLLSTDPRFGAFVTLAIVAQLRGLPSLFAYDPACALVLTAAIVGVAAVFARSRLTLVLVAIGLLTCHWYDHGRTGYFAKILGYPAAITFIGLFLQADRPFKPAALLALLLIAAGATVVYWAEAPLLIIAIVGGPFLVAQALLAGRAARERPRALVRELAPDAIVLGLVGVLGLVVRSYVAQPLSGANTLDRIVRRSASLYDPLIGFDAPLPPWDYVVYALADLLGTARSTLPIPFVQAALVVCLFLWALLPVVAWRWRDARVIALTVGPMILATFFSQLTTTGAQWTRLQLPGTYYPLALGAAALLIDRAPVGTIRLLSCWTVPDAYVVRALTALVLLGIALHLPRWPDALHQYAGSGLPSWLQFSQAEMDDLEAAIGTEAVLVEIPVQPHPPKAFLVELGRRGLDVEWGADAWTWITSGHNMVQPPPGRRATLIVHLTPVPEAESATVVVANRVYRLIRAP